MPFGGRPTHLCEEPTGPAFGRPDDRLRDEAIHSLSFHGGMDCFAALAITAGRIYSTFAGAG